MNLNFGETPSNRNDAWSPWRDDYAPEGPTDAEVLHDSVADEVRLLLGQARHACNLGGITATQLGPIEALAKSWGVK